MGGPHVFIQPVLFRQGTRYKIVLILDRLQRCSLSILCLEASKSQRQEAGQHSRVHSIKKQPSKADNQFRKRAEDQFGSPCGVVQSAISYHEVKWNTMCRLQSVSTVLLVVAVLSPVAQSFSPLPDHNSSGLVKNVDDEDRYLLHAVSEPLSYDLFLDMTDASFSGYSGTVDIMVKYTGSEASFSINSAGLTVNETSLRVTETNDEEVPIKSFVASNDLQQIFFNFDKPLETGAIYKVHIEFNGTISADFFKGLYRSSYRTETDIKYLATTFFAATYARTVFPCYDEPAYKALFNIRIRHLPKHTALSNMPAIQSIQIGEYKETTFDTTPLMSTYLVAFVVSEFQTIHPDAGLFRVFAPENKVNYTTYAHEFAVRSLRAMETHFGRQNQMSKIDLLAIPDFAMGAMENWGLITFREDYLLYENEEQTTAFAKQKIASVITHELVHMWFGNELTPEWWTYVWLNEGFANYYEYFITAQLEPAWNFWEQFTLDNVHYALARDCKSSARQMNFYATDPAVLNELYDYVVYQKSASVIHMMRNVIGHETFRQAINDYLRSRSYLSTKPQYLYTSIEKFRNVDLPDSVEAIFESWANAPGYPVIIVTVDRTRRTLTASQKRFWLPNDVDSPPENKLFFVPLNYASNVPSSGDFENTAPTFWLTPSDPSATVVIETDVDWIIVNKQQTGYYRVNYDVESWNKLIAVLNSDRFDTAVPVINRAQLVDDVANLARAGEADYGVALSLMQYLERETEYIPWSTAYNALLHIDQMFSSNKEYKRFESFCRTITAHVFNETTTTDPGEHSNRLHRDKSGYLACYYGVPACLKEATSVLNLALLDELLSIPKEMQSTAFCALHKYELTVEGDYAIALFEKYWSEQEKYQSLVDKLIDSMGCSRNRATIEFYLDMIKLNTIAFPFTMKMKSNILTSMIKGSPEARAAALRYLNVEFVVVSEILDQQLVPVFDAFAVNINTPAERDMLQQLIDSHLSSMTAPVQQAANRALVQAEQNLRWLGERAGTIAKWLVEQNFDNGGDSDNGNGAETTGPVGGLLAMMYRVALSLVAIAWLRLILASAPVDVEKPPLSRDSHDDSRYLLQKVSEPIAYKLFLDITNYDFYSYTGSVEIEFRYTGDQNHFYLHSDGLVIDESSVKVTRPDGSDLPVANIIYMEQFEQIYLGFSERLLSGEHYKVQMSFLNNIGTELKGLYRSSYVIGNNTRYLATTHFESTYARSVFPCYDEPAYKATFDVRIRHRSEYTALSNMPVVQRLIDGDYTETVFDTTPIMSTYLLAFVISDFKTLSQESDRFRVFAAESKVAHTEYALEFLGKSLRTLETFFGHQYQLPKVDLIAIPDFAMGAMENWGLITFREQYLIYDEGVTTVRTKQNIADLITHELTHMWFGNEVTPEWWTYLWLSEGFARYFEYYITSQLEPTWNLWEQFIVNNVHSALSQDCHSHNRMMSYYATDPAVLNDLFDYVVYAKSASVIRMIQNVIGFDTFQQALNDYLRSRSYLTTKPQYLYASIEKFRNVDLPDSVEAIFESWANAPGYPVITVTVDRTRRTLTASQKRFWLPNDVDSPPENKLFFVPLNYASNVPSSSDFENTAPTFWLTPSNPSATIAIEADVDWIVVNKQQTGYYRVNYDVESWNKLIAVLNSDRFDSAVPVINRAQLVDDVANLARAGEVDYAVALSLMQYLERETEYIPWSTAYNALLYIDRMYSSGDHYDRFESFLRSITGCMYENVLLTGPMDHISRLHRGNTVYLACYSGVQKCLDDAYTLINRTIEDSSFVIPEEVQAAVFCVLHKYPQTALIHVQIELLTKYLESTNDPQYMEMINRFLTSAGCARHDVVLQDYLALTTYNYPGLPITAEHRNQIYLGLINGSPFTRLAALRYMHEHYSTVTYLLTSITPIFSELGNRINSESEYDVLKNIVDDYGHTLSSAAKAAADTALVQAAKNLRWIEQHSEDIETWLIEQNYEGTTTKPPPGGTASTQSVGVVAAFGCA
uniref:Aminopeptidase n=1 Tax=Anopheles dirus TaxID=7168 RepID=A0A182NCK1_9DIPT